MKHYVLYFALASLMFLACVKQVVKQPAPVTTPSSPQVHKSIAVIKKQKKDTVCYFVEFQDSSKRRQFTEGIEHLIKKFPPEPTSDSVKNAVTVQIVQSQPPAVNTGKPIIPDIPAIIPSPQSITGVGPVAPVYGGTVRLYIHRGSVDQDISPLISTFPFDSKSCNGKDSPAGAGYLSIKSVADRAVTLTLTPGVQNGASRPVSAFDYVTGWTDFVKKHPAEARCIFRYVNGVEQFINGREAVITGFQIVDDKTIVLQLTRSDPYAARRLCTSRLLPPSFQLGPYSIKNDKNNSMSLAPNIGYPLGKPFLNSCEIKSGKDPNPFLSYSMRRLDAMTLFSVKDLDYARRMAPDKSNLSAFSADRYFLSLASPSADVRHFVNKIIDKKDILDNYVKAEGTPLQSIETENADPENPAPAAQPLKSTLTTAPPASAVISILFPSDDPVSQLIAEKLLADLSHAGLSCAMKGSAWEDYEKALVRRDYGIAVGWAPASIVFDESERLRLGTMWFNDEYREQARIDSAQEIPLFSIKTYLLSSKKVFFTENGLAGIFVKE